MQTKSSEVIFYTLLALLAFAANSVLCRLALAEHTIDPASFTVIRLLSGVTTFVILLNIFMGKRQTESARSRVAYGKQHWTSAIMLFVYAAAFSFAYVQLETGVGALILFGSVQLTMISVSLIQGKTLTLIEWLGVCIAFSGLTYLVWPTLETPNITGVILMICAGVAWGFYSLAGKGSTNPLHDTATNFTLTVPFVLLLALVSYAEVNISISGAVYAMLSGIFASALGYAIWYRALTGLSATEASVLQLSVPVIAAIGGVVFVGEHLSFHLLIATSLVLGGIACVLLGNKVSSHSTMR
ncbi:DMT family transporter [Thalassotalea euphylliae]|uniref:DMT family transporter n=1 Tax=Thalassotalea euphylliae TaxID=1655234 RepID=UPI00362C24D3